MNSPVRDQYANFADLYDAEMKASDIRVLYREWSEALLDAVTKHGVRVRVLVDLACGTGNTAIPWARRHGWTVVGVDRSAAMLRQARQKSQRVRWYWQDLRALDLEERADVVTCHFDALNHFLARRDLQRIFVNVARILNDGGLFLFDLNTDHMHRWLSGSEKLFRVGPHYFLAYNEYDRKTTIATFHQLWFVRDGQVFRKREVKVHARAYPTADIRRMLRAAGLSLLEHTVQRKLEGKPSRVLYLAQKTRGLSPPYSPQSAKAIASPMR